MLILQALAFALLSTFPGSAEEAAPAPRPAAVAETAAAGSRPALGENVLPEVISLSLKDCVLRAYTNNISLQMSRDAAAAMSTRIEETRGAFDPVFFTNVRGGESVQPSGAQLIGNIGYSDDYDQDFLILESGFRGLLLSGATYQVDVALQRSFIDPEGFNTLNPQVSNNVGVQIKQPLLRNGWTAFNRAEGLRARLDSQREDLNLETYLNDVVFSTIEAYWNLVYAVKDLETVQKSLELAEDLLRINTRKKEEGLFTKMEVLEASTDVATRKEQLITARNAVRTAEDLLKKLIFPFADTSEWDIGIATLTEAQVDDFSEPDLDGLVGQALDSRSDYLALVADKRNREVDLIQAQNQTKPMLDLTGNYRLNSLGTNMGNSFDFIDDRDFPAFSVALSLEVPIGNLSARSVEMRSIIELRRASAALVEKRIEIAYEIREAVRNIVLQLEKLSAARESKRLSEERYQGELKRLEAGRSITYLVREAERNFFLESVKENRALLDYQIALAQLEKAKGSLLEQYDIQAARSFDDWRD